MSTHPNPTVDDPAGGPTTYDQAVAPLTAPISKGLGTILGVVVTVVAGASAIVAGVQGNDTATISGGVVAVLSGLGTLGLRGVQAVERIRAIAKIAEPVVSAAATYTYQPAVVPPSVNQYAVRSTSLSATLTADEADGDVPDPDPPAAPDHGGVYFDPDLDDPARPSSPTALEQKSGPAVTPTKSWVDHAAGAAEPDDLVGDAADRAHALGLVVDGPGSAD